MNKLFKRLTGVALGLALTLGAGITAARFGHDAVSAHAEETKSVSVKISDYATANSWKDATKYTELKLDNNLTVNVTGGSNTGKYYNNGTNWRMYQNESPSIVISGTDLTIKTIKVTYSVSNTGVLTYGGDQKSSGAEININAASATFGVGNTGTATNGQVRITQIDATYVSGGNAPVTPDPEPEEPTPEPEEPTPETGLNTYSLISDLNALSKVVIVSTYNSTDYLLPAATCSSSAPAATPITVDGNTVKAAESDLFTVTKTDTGFEFVNNEGKYLYNYNNNNGVRINTTVMSWKVTCTDATKSTFKMSNQDASRWLGVYNGADWRSYTSSNHDNYKGSGESIRFYGIAKEVAPLKTLTLTGAPTEGILPETTVQLGYTGLDTENKEWTGTVSYASSNTSVATVSSTGLLTALKQGTTQITVSANAGQGGATVTSAAVTITVLAEPTRQDLPNGDYTVEISAIGYKGGQSFPTSHEIKAKDGSNWYKNLSVVTSNVQIKYTNEYTILKGGSFEIINNSNAKITGVTIDWYKSGADITTSTGTVTGTTGTNTSNSSSYVLEYSFEATEGFSINIAAGAQYDASFYTMTIEMSVGAANETLESVTISGTPKTEYKAGQTPTNEGLTAHANYYVGSTLSRSEDVTEAAEWEYSIDQITKETTSFTITATYKDVVSAKFTVNVTILETTGLVSEGQYYISHTREDVTYYLASNGTASAPSAVTNKAEATIFDFTLVDDNTYEITTGEGEDKAYLYSTDTNNGVRVGSTKDSWVIETGTRDTGSYDLKEINNNRFLTLYVSEKDAKYDFRAYTSASGQNRLENTDLVEVKSDFETVQDFVDNFMHMTDVSTDNNADTGACKGPEGYYVNAKREFNSLTTAQKELFVTDATFADAYLRLTKWAEANGDTFDTNYSLVAKNSGLFSMTLVNDNNSYILIIIAALVAASALTAYLVINKRRKINK